MHMGEGRGSSTPEQKGLSRGFRGRSLRAETQASWGTSCEPTEASWPPPASIKGVLIPF